MFASPPEPKKYRRGIDVAYLLLTLVPWTCVVLIAVSVPRIFSGEPGQAPVAMLGWMTAAIVAMYASLLAGGILALIHRGHRPLLIPGVAALVMILVAFLGYVDARLAPAPWSWLDFARLGLGMVAAAVVLLGAPLLALLWFARWRKRARAQDAFDPAETFR